MARKKRDYAAEYRRRVQRARELGYQGYYQRRIIETDAARYENIPGQHFQTRSEFYRKAKDPPAGMSTRDVINLFREGDRALRRRDHQQAEYITELLGYELGPLSNPQSPPGSQHPANLFWYH